MTNAMHAMAPNAVAVSCKCDYAMENSVCTAMVDIRDTVTFNGSEIVVKMSLLPDTSDAAFTAPGKRIFDRFCHHGC